jgi:hypothetical protein
MKNFIAVRTLGVHVQKLKIIIPQILRTHSMDLVGHQFYLLTLEKFLLLHLDITLYAL